MQDRDETFQGLIRDLGRCERRASALGLELLPRLISAAQIEAAIQWDGGAKALGDPQVKLDRLIRMKIRLALSDGETGAMVIFSDRALS